MAKKIVIHSRDALPDDTIQKVKEIMRQSSCPNESLRKTFHDYIGIDSGIIHFNCWYPKGYVYEMVLD